MRMRIWDLRHKMNESNGFVNLPFVSTIYGISIFTFKTLFFTDTICSG